MTSPIIPVVSPDRQQLAVAERNARRFWVSLIVGLLGIQVIIGVGSIYLSLGDPTVAVIPNYHQAALDWDVKHRAQETLRKLGWDVRVHVAPIAGGTRTLRVNVLGDQTRAIAGLNIEAMCFHHARGSDVYRTRLTEVSPGEYAASTPLTKAGVWQIELSIEGDHGIAHESLEMNVQ